jgi:murein DD-endopeptidase MepM/ murein hydrolase activator NlpD
MANTEKPKKSWKDKIRFIVINDNTFEEVTQVRFSKFEIVAGLAGLVFLIIAITSVLIAFTNIRELIPGYPDGDMRWNIIMNSYKLDSIENELRKRDQYFYNLNAIIAGENPDSLMFTASDTNIQMNEIQFSSSIEDSLLREQIESEEVFTLSLTDNRRSVTDISDLFLMPPVKGLVINKFNPQENHLGTDIVSGPNELVKATLEGTVVSATWTLKTGYVIQIQHENNLISVYKHNRELLKEEGNRVKAGDAIAIVGNTGELTTGPHLHFELWYKGNPINPEDYIVF